MIINAGFLDHWEHKGHRYGECMSHKDSPLMYVYISKNASSWTKPNLKDFCWEFYNYHKDQLDKHAMIVLRDPVERWLSGIAEYFALYHNTIDTTQFNSAFFDLVFDRVCFDDHTACQVNFLDGLDTENCTFLYCDRDYSKNFSNFVAEHLGPNRYAMYTKQHVSRLSPVRRQFNGIFKDAIQNSKYLEQVKQYYKQDYTLINQVKFYGTR